MNYDLTFFSIVGKTLFIDCLIWFQLRFLVPFFVPFILTFLVLLLVLLNEGSKLFEVI